MSLQLAVCLWTRQNKYFNDVCSDEGNNNKKLVTRKVKTNWFSQSLFRFATKRASKALGEFLFICVCIYLFVSVFRFFEIGFLCVALAVALLELAL